MTRPKVEMWRIGICEHEHEDPEQVRTLLYQCPVCKKVEISTSFTAPYCDCHWRKG